MTLKKGDISNPLIDFILESQKEKSEDPTKSIENFCNKIESIIFEVLKENDKVVINPGQNFNGTSSAGPITGIITSNGEGKIMY